MLNFKSFFNQILIENRLNFIKSQHAEIDSSHDALAKHKKASDIIDHFATHADPTKKKVYTQWIVNRYKNKEFRQEDHPRIKETLTSFDKNKPILPQKDINQYPSLRHLQDALPKEQHLTNKELDKKHIETGSDLIHQEKGLTVHRLKTHEASCVHGRGTDWCTAKEKHPETFHEYNKRGPLYVIHLDD